MPRSTRCCPSPTCALLEATDNVAMGGKAEDFARQIEAESQANARIIQAAGIQLN